MCGVVGIISKDCIDKNSFSQTVHALHHRGPDAQGIFYNEERTVALGHTRLSIIDLSTAANQPFESQGQQYVIVFNGEIYNFQSIRNELERDYAIHFKTHSDTEVIVEAFAVWKAKMVERLEGMFAIAIYDKETNKLCLFRDRMGKKPLFYFQSDGFFAFASEIKALLKLKVVQDRATINQRVIPTFLHLGYIPEPFTIYSNIFKFPSAHYAEVNPEGELMFKEYWSLESHIPSKRVISPGEAKDKLNQLLHNAVEKRLISDVPLGSFLSGGTDSSLVTAIANKIKGSPIKTFSIGFAESKFDESKFAGRVANHLQTDHTEYMLQEKEALDIMATYLDHFDEPFADTSAIPTMLVSKLARKEVTVALTGDGGDELFQGYGAYNWANRLDSIGLKMVKSPMRKVFELSGKSRLERIAHLLEPVKVGGIRSHIFSQEQYFFSQGEIKNTLLKDKGIFNPFHYNDPSDKLTAGESQALFDLHYYLKDDLLVKVDRASMFYGLECRSPLLDRAIVEFAFGLDVSLKVRDGKSKWVLKELLREYLPSDLVDRPKWGFSVPLAIWLKNDLRYLIDAFLSDAITEELGLFDVNYVKGLVNKFFGGKDYLYNRIWVLVILQKWMKENQ